LPGQPLLVDIEQWADVQSARKPKLQNADPPGGFSFGTNFIGGPQYTDPFASKRAPSPWQLVENYNSIVYAMVACNRDAISRIPLRLYADGSRAQGGKPRSACDPIRVSRHIGQRLSRAGKVSPSAVDQVYEVRDHPFLTTLDKPDPDGYFDRQQLIGLMVSYCDVVGHCELIPEGNGWDWRKPNPGRIKGPPEALWVIYPQYVIPIRKPRTPLIDFFQYFQDRIPFSSAIWFRQNISLRDAYASSFSPTYASETYRLQEQEQVQILSQVLGLGPRQNLLVTNKDPAMPMGDPERKRLEQDLMRRHSKGNAGGVLVVNGSLEATPMSYSPADMAGKEMAEYDLYRMAAIFGQPATYYTVDTNINNLQAADEQHARKGVEPRLRMIEGPLNHLVKQWDERLFFKFDPALPEDEESHMKVVEMRLKNGLTTPNQENEESQWPAFPEGDEHWIDGTRKTMTMLLEEHATMQEQSKQAMESGETQDELAVDGHEHQKTIDKAKLKIDAKKAQQKPAPKRSVEELAESVLLDIQAEITALRAG